MRMSLPNNVIVNEFTHSLDEFLGSLACHTQHR